jgi:hypothetical protein
MNVEYQERARHFLSLECLDSSYENLGIAMFKLRMKYCIPEYSCIG